MADPQGPGLVQAVIDVIVARPLTRTRTSSTGELWYDLCCPLHDDQHPSAGFQPQTGVFHCFTCNKTLSVVELAQALMVAPPITPPPPRPPRLTVLSSPPPAGGGELIAAEYRYYFPDGTPSHLVRRMENPLSGKKRFLQWNPDATIAGLPESNWPIYEPVLIPKQSYLLVVEGEKAVHAILDALGQSHTQTDHPIATLTWNGGAGSAEKHATTLARRIKELDPEWVTLWPDHDEPGFKAMSAIALALKKEKIACSLIEPAALNLPPKGDVVEFLAAGGSLVDLVLRFRGQDQDVIDFVAQLIVLEDAAFVYPQTRVPVKVSLEEINAAWQTVNRRLPTARQVRDAHSRLTGISHQRPVRSCYRTAHLVDAFYWRASPQGKCFYVSQKGVGVADDPPGNFILLPPIEPHYPSGIEPGGLEDFTELIDRFHLDPQSAVLLEGWLCCTLLGLQTPLLLIRGPAGSGKTTLAKALLAIVEPTVPELDASIEISRADRRELIRTLEHNHALLLDNVSAMSRSMEDTFSKLVTETTHMIRPLYEDHSIALRMHRSLIVTTITWDMFKSDLISRTVPVATKPLMQHASDTELTAWVKQRLDRLRGYIFQRCVQVYREGPKLVDRHYDLRMGDLGYVLTALGYDERAIAAEIRQERARTISQNDGWMDVIVGLWGGTPRMIQAKVLAAEIEAKTGETVPPAHLGRYVQEKAESFKDFGFVIDTSRRTAAGKMYRFVGVEESATQEELHEDV